MSVVYTSFGIGALLSYGIYNRFSSDNFLETKNNSSLEELDLEIKPGAMNRNPYTFEKIPKNLNAIVIGSTLGGLTTAALLAKAGWKVLVVDRELAAGGGHLPDADSIIKPEFGFTLTKDILDLITDISIEWIDIKLAPLSSLSSIPLEEIKKSANHLNEFFFLKVLQPLWLRRLLINRMYSIENNGFLVDKVFSSITQTSVISKLKEINIEIDEDSLESLDSLDSKTSFWLHSLKVNQYLTAQSCPKINNYEEIILSIIPTIEKTDGRVLVWNGVKEILLDQSDNKRKIKVIGVIMDNDLNEIKAPIIISDIGLTETYSNLIPESIANELCGWQILKKFGVDTNYYSPKRFDPKISQYLEPQTGIEGLFLTGKTITFPGIHGSILSGFLTASSILGYGTMIDAFRGRNLLKDLRNTNSF